MKIRQIYDIVKALDQGQKSAMTRFVKSHTSSKSQLEALYERIRTTREFNSKTEWKIRGKEFKDPKTYYQYRVSLMDLIIRGLVQIKGAKTDPFEYIKEAVSLGATTLASKMFVTEFSKAQSENNTGYIALLIELKSELEYEYRLQLDLGDLKLPSLKEVASILNSELKLRRCLEEIRIGLKSEPKTWLERARKIEELISSALVHSSKSEYLALKGRVGVHVLRNENLLAGELQGELTEKILAKDFSLSPGVELREIASYIQYALAAKEKGKVSRGLFQISRLNLNSPALEGLRRFYRVRFMVVASSVFVDLEMGNEVLPDLIKSRTEFPAKDWVRMVFAIATVHLFQGKFKDGVKCLVKINDVPKSEIGDFHWQPTFLLLLLHFELGNMGVIEPLLNQAKLDMRESSSAFPGMVYQSLSRLFKLYGAFSFKDELKKTLGEFSIWEADNPLDSSPLFVDYSLWLKAKISGQNMAEIQLDHNRPENFRGAMIS